MGTEEGQVHRSGPLKQANKSHKHGRHRSKGSISISSKGKVSVKSISKKNKRVLNREQRRNQSIQIRQNKRDEALAKKRCLGGADNAPFLVCILPLQKNLDLGTVLGILKQCDSEAVISESPTGVTHIWAPRFKQKFSFVCPATDNDFAILDTLKICDSVLFVVSVSTGIEDETMIDDWGQNMLVSAFSQGLSTPLVAVTDLESIAPKKRHEHKQFAQKLISKWLPDQKIIPLDMNVDGINVLRRIGSQKKKSVLYRDRRPHLYAEEVVFVPNETGPLGTLQVTGYLRGTALSVNGLIHIPGMGDFQMSQIDAPFDPFSVNQDASERNFVRILEKSDESKQESLDSECVPDPMDDEQTWPTEEELEEAERKVKPVKKVPSGWSAYQSAWIPDNDIEFQEDEENDEEDDCMEAKSDSDKSDYVEVDKDNETEVAESEIGVNDERYDQQMDIYAEKQALEKLKAAKSDRMYPDEIDTPLDQPARTRFQKYRGLESFRTSPWDLNENLPDDYGRIFHFGNFDRFRKTILKECNDVTGACSGWFITVHVKDVSQLVWENFEKTGAPVVLIGLLPHEHKMSVLNVVLKRTLNYNLPIKSKEQLVFQCGCRRFIVNPIFSQHTNGQKHKFERFFQPESTSVATFYAPTQFPPAPVLCYKEIQGKLVLVATGNLLSCNPDRIILKRIALTGHPFKIYKRSSVVRFMFFGREDINYYKPCKLRTKLGRIGHIKEPLGTHGHMKCIFDGQLKSQDTVVLNLYKRVFPKWTFEHLIVSISDSMET